MIETILGILTTMGRVRSRVLCCERLLVRPSVLAPDPLPSAGVRRRRPVGGRRLPPAARSRDPPRAASKPSQRRTFCLSVLSTPSGA